MLSTRPQCLYGSELTTSIQARDELITHLSKYRGDVVRGIGRSHALLVIILVSVVLAVAQQPPYYQPSTAAYTPMAEQPGAPVGSYPLSGFDNVNLFNGHMNFRLPLMHIGGRGRAGYTMMLPIEQHWQELTIPVPTCNQSGCTYYDSNIHYIANPNWWTGLLPGFGPGVLNGRPSGSGAGYSAQGCSTPIYYYTLTRLTFTAPDGTEMELRDQLTGGQPIHGGGPPGCYGGPSRGRVFVTADGSSATFVSDSDISDDKQPHQGNVIYPSGFLLLRDGTRYRIANGLTSWIRDANGNQVNFTYSGNQLIAIDDSLNRHVSITYGNPTIISFKGTGGTTRTIKIYSASQSTVLRKHPDGSTEYTIKTFAELFGLPNSQYFQTGTFDNAVTSAVELPDGRQYQFRYDSYANLAQVILPTGGRMEYDWTTSAYPFGDHVYGIIQRVLERRTAVDTTTWNYETRTTYSNPSNGGTDAVTVDNLDPKNGNALKSRSKHYFHGPFVTNPAGDNLYPGWQEGQEYQTEFFAADGTTVLRRTNYTFQQRAVVSWWTGSADLAPPNDPRLVETTTTLVDTNQVSKISAINPNTGAVGFDQYNNQTDVWEYDYSSGSTGPLLRHSATSFLTSGYDTLIPNSTSPNVSLTYHIRSLPFQTSIYDGAGIERARTSFEYDNYTTDSFHAPLVDRANISGHDSAVSTSYLARGNPTAASSYLLPAGTAITSYSQFDIAGNVVKVIDPRSTSSNIIATSVFYDDNFGAPDSSLAERFTFTELGSQQTFAFPTEVRNAFNQSGFTQYDYYLGQGINQQDFNGVVVAGYHNDLLDRLTQVRRAFNTSAENQTTFEYDDVNHTITTKSDLTTNNDNVRLSKVLYDGLGRTTEKQLSEGGGNFIITQLQYDFAGRAYMTSNPFRPTSEGAIWTTQLFDSLGRVVSVTTPDTATVTTSYPGNAVIVTDQVGKQRKSVTDALGRLVKVYEAPNDANYNYLTSYTYDALDNLTGVSQGFQSRSFIYDSLKRLTSATNPESGTISYQYDNAGNLLVKTDARGVSAHFDYDGLGRIVRRWYNGSNSVSSTINNNPQLPVSVGASDEANFYYDSQTLPTGAPAFSRGASIGRIVAVTYGGSTSTTGDYSGYDAVGRYTLKIQRIGSTDYQLSTAPNVAGLPTAITYPSGHTASYTYDTAARVITFTGTLGDGTSRNYSTEALYSPFGGLTKEKFGNALYNKLFYNSRGQLAEIKESTSWTGPTDTSWNRGTIINDYSDNCSGMCGGSNSTTAMPDNNGNLRKQWVYVPNNEQIPTTDYSMRWQQYDYDPLNRLNWVRETYNNVEQWKQAFTYDRFGNRTINTSLTYGSGINNKPFTVTPCNSVSDPCTNRLGVPTGQSGAMQYDGVGNLTNDTYTGAGSRTYDAENKMTVAVGGIQSSGNQLYKYDASGQRIKRTVDGVETWAVYGFSGEMVAEYPINGAATSPQKEYGYRNGQLLVTAETVSQQSTQNVSWTNAVGVSASGNSLTKTAADGWGNGGAASTQAIVSGDGYAEFTVSETNTYRMFGLSHGDSDQNYPDIDFAVYAYSGGVLQVYEAGVLKTTSTYAAGDRLRVAVEGGVVKYRRNGTLFYTSSTAPTYPLLVDTSLYSNGCTITNAVISGVLSGSGSAQNVSWTNTVGVSASGNSLTKTAADGWGNGGAASTQAIVSGDGYAEFTVSETNTYRMFGLSHGDSDQNYPDIDFAVYAYSGGVLQVYEAGVLKTTSSYAAGDRLRVAVEGGVVKYRRNGTLFYTSSTAPTYPLLVDTSLYSNGCTITDAAISGIVTQGAVVSWLVTDQLGTPRMIFDESGALANVKRHDYLPFGEEIIGTLSGRGSGIGYGGGDGVRQQFTLKERDNETGLDFFATRYNSSLQGRFTSTDSYNIILEKEKGRNEREKDQFFVAYVSQPQNWNKYTYTLNNPLRYSDPDGRRAVTEDDYKRLTRLVDEYNKALHAHDSNLADAIKGAVDAIVKAIQAVPEGQADPANLKAVFFAIDNLGNTSYGRQGTVDNGVTVSVGPGDNKCNIFVANAYANGAGIGFDGKGVPTASTFLGGLLGRKNPPSANDLSNPSKNIANFPVVTNPSVGDIVAMPPGPNDVLGHSGINAGGGAMIYAGPRDVKIQTITYVMTVDSHPSVVYRMYKP